MKRITGFVAGGAPVVLLVITLAFGTIVGTPTPVVYAADQATGDVVMVDLSRLYNNDGVATEDDPIDGDLDGLGWSLMAEEMPAPGSVIKVDGVSFRIPETLTEPFVENNVQLLGQRIDVLPGRYYDVYFLATATNGSKKADVTFVYADGSTGQSELRVSDWCGEAKPHEVAAVQMTGRYGPEGKQDLRVTIFATKLAVDPQKELIRIEFGEEVNIHLFALSLGKKPGLLQVAAVPLFQPPAAVKQVDISSAFNQDGISTAANPGDGNLDNVGWSLAAEVMPPSGKVTKLAGVDFQMPDYTDGKLNNIEARGQELKVPTGQYHALYMLALAHNGGQRSKLTINYADGSTQVVDLMVSDWCGGPDYGEGVAIEMPYRYDRKGKSAPACRLFRLWWNLDPAKTLTSITLPDNPNIHVFAISLGLPEAQ